MSNKIRDIQNLTLDLSIFSVYGHGARVHEERSFIGLEHMNYEGCSKISWTGRIKYILYMLEISIFAYFLTELFNT